MCHVGRLISFVSSLQLLRCGNFSKLNSWHLVWPHLHLLFISASSVNVARRTSFHAEVGVYTHIVLSLVYLCAGQQPAAKTKQQEVKGTSVSVRKDQTSSFREKSDISGK